MANFVETVTLAAGDTIDFAVGRGADGNLYGSGLQISATLTLNHAPPVTDCLSAPSGLVAWWPLDGNAGDIAGSNPGNPAGSPVFADGKVRVGLRFDGGDDSVRVPASAALDIGAGAGLTVEMWLSPAGLDSPRALLEWSTTTGPEPGFHLFTSVFAPGSLFANLIDVNGVAHHFTWGGQVQGNRSSTAECFRSVGWLRSIQQSKSTLGIWLGRQLGWRVHRSDRAACFDR
jgi:hypothetical protein